MKKENPSKNLAVAGFYQSLGVVFYCVLVSSLLWYLSHFFKSQQMNILGSSLMLIVSVISAGIMGTIVFGYPVYLILNRKIKESLLVLVYTLLFSLGIIGAILIFLANEL